MIPTGHPPLGAGSFCHVRFPGHDLPAVWKSFRGVGGAGAVEIDLTVATLPAGSVLRFDTNQLPQLEPATTERGSE